MIWGRTDNQINGGQEIIRNSYPAFKAGLRDEAAATLLSRPWRVYITQFEPNFSIRQKAEMGTIGRAIYTVGFRIRETGQALDRLGGRLRGNYHFREQLSRYRTLMNVFDKVPAVDKNAFVAPSASIIGDVHVGQGSSIWYGCVLRGKFLR